MEKFIMSEQSDEIKVELEKKKLLFFSKPKLFSKVFNFIIDETKSVISLGWYFPSLKSKSDDEFFEKDDWSKTIYALKGYAGVENQNKIIERVAKFITKLMVSNANILILAVPSRTVSNQNHGATKLVQKISEISDHTFICGNDLLIRTKTVSSSHYDLREPEKYQPTISVINSEAVKGKTILLLDDVVTTGTVIKVCQEKLEQAGANRVVCLTLGRTVSGNRRRNEDFPIPPLCENIPNLALINNTIFCKNNHLAKEWYHGSYCKTGPKVY